MTRDDIIRIAEEVAAYADKKTVGTDEDEWAVLEHFVNRLAAAVSGKCNECGKAQADGWALNCVKCYEDFMEKPAVKAAVAAEREACAKVCDDRKMWLTLVREDDAADGAEECANFIRARGEK